MEDDPFLGEATVALLKHEGHKVFSANTGKKAIELCSEHKIHVMLLDYKMPGLDGSEVVSQVRQFNRDMQIILQTGFIEKPPRQMLKELDIQGYHDKSEGPEKLLLWVDVALKSYEQISSKRALEGSLLALGIALEARDLETAGHTERVVTFAAQVGQKLKLNEKQLLALRQGAYLHDLGKLSVPDAILLKPDKLEPHEWEVMKGHSEKGFELASLVSGLDPEALNVIRHHHERWDGKGYPLGLTGEAIPLLARIFALCDVFDALTSKRSYKPAQSLEAAIQEIRNNSGSHFDPQLVEIFIGAISVSSNISQTSGQTEVKEFVEWPA